MGKSLFMEDIKTVAKRIVAASNGNFKQTEVLDLLASRWLFWIQPRI